MEQEASNSNKNEEIILLEKQGRSSQKIRSNGMGNLAQVSQSVGQNMTDISHIGTTPNKVSFNFSLFTPKSATFLFKAPFCGNPLIVKIFSLTISQNH